VTVGANQDISRAQFERASQTRDAGLVFGNVVRGFADTFGDLGQRAAGLVGDKGSDRRRTGVASARAVAGDDQASIRIRRQ
jgi:hypothetical protein